MQLDSLLNKNGGEVLVAANVAQNSNSGEDSTANSSRNSGSVESSPAASAVEGDASASGSTSSVSPASDAGMVAAGDAAVAAKTQLPRPAIVLSLNTGAVKTEYQNMGEERPSSVAAFQPAPVPPVSFQPVPFQPTSVQQPASFHVASAPAPVPFESLEEIEAIPAKFCSNCGSTSTSSWRRDLSRKKLLCNPCGLHFRIHKTNKKTTPEQRALVECYQRLTQMAIRTCSHCFAKRTSRWHCVKNPITGRQDHLCEKCGVFYQENGAYPPLKRAYIKPKISGSNGSGSGSRTSSAGPASLAPSRTSSPMPVNSQYQQPSQRSYSQPAVGHGLNYPHPSLNSSHSNNSSSYHSDSTLSLGSKRHASLEEFVAYNQSAFQALGRYAVIGAPDPLLMLAEATGNIPLSESKIFHPTYTREWAVAGLLHGMRHRPEYQ